MSHFILRKTAYKATDRHTPLSENCQLLDSSPRIEIAQCGVSWLSPCVAYVPLLLVTHGCQGGGGHPGAP